MKTNEALVWLACLALLCPVLKLAAAEEMAVVKEGHVNVRGQPSLAGEVITQLQKGEKVVVLEQVTVAKPKTNEPPKWARIQMPANTPVWINASFIDPASKTVKVPRLNLRAGPGENFSVVGRLERGAAVTEIRRVEDWMEVETPPGAYAFVAADLLTKPELAGPAAMPVQPPAKTPPVVTSPPTAIEPPKAQPEMRPSVTQFTPTNPVVTLPPPPTEAPKVQPESRPSITQLTPTNQIPPGPTPFTPAHPMKTPSAGKPQPAVPPPTAVLLPSSTTTVQPAATFPAKAKPEEEQARRIVRREGLVRSTVSIQAPTYYELLNPDNRKTINYLHTDKLAGLNLKDYRGRRIVVTGEEFIDPRWPKTPVIEVDTLELIP